MESWYDENEALPEAHRILTREELFTHAHEFAVELVRWKVWHVQDQAQARVAEAQAIQALALALVALLSGTQDAQTGARMEFARAATFLGYTLQDRRAVVPRP